LTAKEIKKAGFGLPLRRLQIAWDFADSEAFWNALLSYLSA
jgi:hypothetical protein